MSKRIVVLMGGRSIEREVSLVSGAAVADALVERGHDVTAVDVGSGICEILRDAKPDVVFNALHGRFGEDGCIQGLLETLEIPYTHSGVLASAMAMDKPTALALFRVAGIQCPEGSVARRDQVQAGQVMEPPYVLKPTNEGSSVGVVMVDKGNPFESQPWGYGDQVLIERFIPGRELSVAVMGGEALGVIEVKPNDGFYDYEAKYADGGSEHVAPAQVPSTVYDACMDAAVVAHNGLGCRGITRSDFRYDDAQGGVAGIYLLEINTQPGMTRTSLVPEIAADKGISFGALVEWMVEDAGCER